MHSTRFSPWRSFAFTAIVVLPLFALTGCSDTPMQPESRSAHVAVVATDSVSMVRVSATQYDLTVTRQCDADNATSLTNATPLTSSKLAPTGASYQKIGGGGSNPCGCPATTTPPSHLPGWTCTLKTWECKPGSGVTSCSYSCTPPTRQAYY